MRGRRKSAYPTGEGMARATAGDEREHLWKDRSFDKSDVKGGFVTTSAECGGREGEGNDLCFGAIDDDQLALDALPVAFV